MAAPIRHVNLWNCISYTLIRRKYTTPTSSFVEKKPLKRKKKRTFVDSLRVFVRGGAGGQGLPKHGGVGGDGGRVVMVARQGETLVQLAERSPDKRFIAGSGKNSRKLHLLGENGKELRVNVPVGVVVKTKDGRVVGDLNEAGQEVVVSEGGRGGNPANNFLGQKGQAHNVQLDLKLIADIGLVGFPNAGKSTFLSAVSRAKPKIAEYPFTTIRPQLGVMAYADNRQISVADLPGLIEGAHVNYGMGHKFLKHVERTKLLVLLVDVFGFSLGVQHKHRSPFHTVLLLNKELELYREDLLDKPAVLALNKLDVSGGEECARRTLQQIKRLPESLNEVAPEMRPSRLLQFDEVFMISGKTGQGVSEMKTRLRELLDLHHMQHTQQLSYPHPHPHPHPHPQEQATSKLV